MPTSTSTEGLYTLGVDAQNEGVKIPLGDLFEGVKKPATDAQTAANNAVTTANAAKTMAANAQGNANTAIETANAAKSAADEAKSAADTATDIANDAADTADAAKTAADNAVATANGTKTELSAIIAPRLFINAQVLLELSGAHSLDTVIGMLASHANAAMFKQHGVVITFMGESGWESWQYTWHLRSGQMPPAQSVDMFLRASSWTKFGGSAAVGNTYNVTVDAPLQAGYYTLATAIAKAYEKGFNNIGLQITFAIADKSWKSYQFIGATNDETAFTNENNWIDLAGMSAGSETLINIDALCGPCKSTTYYTLEYAIAALQALSTATGIDYAKPGLVITYQSGENKFETRQFQSTVGNFGEASLWVPFGGGGDSTVKTSDDPEADGKDAFSTGGAYTNIPTAINIDAETEGVVKLALENAAGDRKSVV